jgi:ketosteroid isomerase-like protein
MPNMRPGKSAVLALIPVAVITLVFAIVFVPSQAQPKDSSDVATIMQLEQDMGNAMIAGDVDKLSQMYADDFATVGSSGKVITKQTLLTDFKSFHDKLEWFENGPMNVQVYGNVAVAHARVSEKRSHDGKDTSGQFVWVDVLEKRDGKWVVVQTAGARLK